MTAGKQYQARVTVKIVSGTWRLSIYNTSGVIDYSDQPTAGQWVLTAGIDEEAQVGGTVGLRLVCTDASGECYADAAVFQEIADRADTGWYQNTKSQAEYGTIELIESEAGMTDAAANALAENTLNSKAWARVKPPTQIDTPERESGRQPVPGVPRLRGHTAQLVHRPGRDRPVRPRCERCPLAGTCRYDIVYRNA